MARTCATRTASRCRASRTARSSRSTACASASPAWPTSNRRACPRRRTCSLPRRVDDHEGAGRGAAREGADFVVAVLHCDRGDAIKLQYERAADLLLTGHTHDLFINYDGSCAHRRVRLRRALRHLRRRRRSRCAKTDGKRTHDLVAEVPRDRHRDGDARPGGRGRGRALRGAAGDKMSVAIGTTAVELDSRNRDGAHARGRDRQPVRRRDARRRRAPTPP